MVNSTSKCTTESLTEHLVGRLVVEALPGSIIQFFDNYCNIFIRDGSKISSFRKVLAQETIGILVGSPLPGSIRIGKVDFESGSFFQFFKV